MSGINTSKIDALAMAAEASAGDSAGEIQSRKTAHTQDVLSEPSDSSKLRADGLDVPSVEEAASSHTNPRQSLNGESMPVASLANHDTPAAPTSNKRKPSFVDKLHAILSDKNCSDIISWLPSGKSFVILDKAGFTKTVLPVYFKEAKFGKYRITRSLFSFAHIMLYASYDTDIYCCLPTLSLGSQNHSQDASKDGAFVMRMQKGRGQSFTHMSYSRRIV